MTLISFRHSIKYILIQMLPYLTLTAFTAYRAMSLDITWFFAYMVTAGISLWRYGSLVSTLYLFTHDMLIIISGIVVRDVDCRALWQLKGMQVRRNRLLRIAGVSNVFCGLEGAPADRIRVIGIDDSTLLKVLGQLSDGIDRNLAMWQEHFQRAVSSRH